MNKYYTQLIQSQLSSGEINNDQDYLTIAKLPRACWLDRLKKKKFSG